MNLGSLQQSVRPARESGLQLLIPVLTVLIAGLVIILVVSPSYLSELHPLTLLLLSVACALPVWALNQLMWWHIAHRISDELVTKIIAMFEIPQNRRRVYAFALSRLLKSLNILRFVPYRDMANLATVITIYTGSAICYLVAATPPVVYVSSIGLSLLIWIMGLIVLHRSCRKIDVATVRDLWLELKDQDELLASVHEHLVGMEKRLMASFGEVKPANGVNVAGQTGA